MTNRLLALTPALVLLTSACGSDSTGTNDAPDATIAAQPDAAPSSADCDGNESVLLLQGAVERSVSSLVYVTVEDKIKGFGAIADSLSFKTSSSALEGYIHDVGVYDVGDVEFNMQFVDYTAGDPLCESNPCEGFYALAGTYEVTEHGAKYRATFALSDLRTLGADGPGDPLPGSVTGCLTVDAP